MKVSDIIEKLKTLPQDAEMGHLWDGAVRSNVDCVYLAKSGMVVGAPEYQSAYYDEDRPKDAPSEDEDPYYKPFEHLTDKE